MLQNQIIFNKPSVGRIKCSSAPGYFSMQSRTSGVAIKYVNDGVERYQVGSNRFEVKAGRYILLPIGCDYAVSSREDQASQGLCLDVGGASLSKKLFANLPSDPFFRASLGWQSINPLGNLLNKFSEDNLLQNTDKQSLIEEIEAQLFAFSDQASVVFDKFRKSHKKNVTQQRLAYKLLLAKQFIDQHYSTQLSLSRIAEHCQLSRFHLSRLFRQTFDGSIHEYLTQQRLDEANRLILKGHLTLTQIAHQVGFFDLSAFSNCYKKRFGMSPRGKRTCLIKQTIY